MADKKEKVINNIDHLTKAIPVPKPKKVLDIDLDNKLYDNILDQSTSSTQIDLNAINSFTNISKSRDSVYDLIDLMCEDPIITAAVNIYTSDACEPNESGKVVWCESTDTRVLNVVTYILDSINVDKYSYGWVYNLVKYGDIYLRLYRDSEFKRENEEDKKLNEDVIFNTFSKKDHYSKYLELVKNPAEVFDLQQHAQTQGYLKTTLPVNRKTPNDILSSYTRTSQFLFKFQKDDVDVFPATEFVHACLDSENDRISEEVYIGETSSNPTEDQEDVKFKFNVRRGKSILYNSFKIWRELQLLENAVLLGRLTRSSIIRTVSVEVGDMEKNDVRNLLNRIKGMVEQKSALNVGTSLNEYTNPGPMENVIYVPTHDGKGTITPGEIGGDVNVGDLGDIKYWQQRLFGSLGIPKQYLGCLRGNTKILLLNGKTVTIEEMFNNLDEYLGKGIMACNEDGSLQPTTITNVSLTKPSTSFIRIHLDNGNYVDVTSDHKMMLRDGTFTYAENLKVGDSLMPYYDKIVDGRRYVLDNKEGKYKKQYRVVAESVCDIPKGYQVHHLDEIKINDDFDNLQPMTISEHYNKHKDMLLKKAYEEIAKKRDAGLYKYRDITNGVEYRRINTLTSELPSGWWFEGIPKPDDFGEKISKALKGVSKNYDCYSNFGNLEDIYAKTKATKEERKAAGLYNEQYANHSKWCKENNCIDYMNRARLAKIPENRRSKERYVRCPVCGKIERIKVNDDWYNDYLNENLFWFCSKECAKVNGGGKLARSYKLYKEYNNEEDYEFARLHGESRPDTYFKFKALEEKLEMLENYVPECNHRVVALEVIDVNEPAYDISVLADCHTFALPCGIFVHNCTDDNTGFNGGTSLSIISSRYAKSVKLIQNAYLQALTDAVHLILIDMNLTEYINKFTLKMQAPTTQEERDRRDNLSSSLSNVQTIMGMLDMIDDPQTKLELLKALLSQTLNNNEVSEILQAEIERFEKAGTDMMSGEASQEGGGDFGGGAPFSGGGGSVPLDLGGGADFGTGEGEAAPDEDLGELGDAGTEGSVSTDLSAGGEEAPAEESFYNKGGELLNEEGDDDRLPSWEQLGVNYNHSR